LRPRIEKPLDERGSAIDVGRKPTSIDVRDLPRLSRSPQPLERAIVDVEDEERVHRVYRGLEAPRWEWWRSEASASPDQDVRRRQTIPG